MLRCLCRYKHPLCTLFTWSMVYLSATYQALRMSLYSDSQHPLRVCMGTRLTAQQGKKTCSGIIPFAILWSVQMSFLFKLETIKCWVEGGGWRVEGGRWRVKGRRVPRKEEMRLWFTVRVTDWSCVTPHSAISAESGQMKDDFGHLLDFLQHLRKLKVVCCSCG